MTIDEFGIIKIIINSNYKQTKLVFL